MRTLGIQCPYYITMAGGVAKMERDGYIEIEGTKITYVGKRNKTHKPSKLLKLDHHVVLPGLINSHSHLAMTLFRGLADDLPFSKWLFETILPLEQKKTDRKFVRIGTEVAAAELIRHGVTTTLDMYFFVGDAAQVLGEAGLRGLVTQGTIDFPSPDRGHDLSTVEPGLNKLLKLIQKYPKLRAGLAPHAPYSCTDERLLAMAKIRDRYNVPLTIHVGETKHECDESLQKYKETPFERMERLGITHPTSIFAHCVHANDKDIEILARTQTGVSHCPESNMKLGAGICPVPKMLARGVKVGLGTDGAASNNNLNILNEADSAAKLQKLANGDNTAMTAATALNLATYGNAQVMGISGLVGSLEVGKEADLIAIDINQPHLTPVHDLVSSLVYSASSLEVSLTMCGGEILYQDGKFKTLDWPKVQRAAEGFVKEMVKPDRVPSPKRRSGASSQKPRESVRV